jgi:hypothetical protein
MTDKKTRKEISAVIQKYLGKDNDYANQKNIALLGVPVIALGIGMDLLFTGGLFSLGVGIGSFGTSMGIAGGGCLLFNSRKKSRTNDAGQTFKCAAPINDTLAEIGRRLKESFNTAALVYASQDDKKAFRLLAAEIEQDVRKLSPAFKIVSGGPNGFSTDRYEFIVTEISTPDGQKKQLTLTRALQYLKPAPPPEKLVKLKKQTQKENAQHLKARLEAIENPRKPPSP